MSEFTSMPRPALSGLAQELEARHAGFKARGLNLDMTRGKPSSEQLDLANDLWTKPQGKFTAKDGTDGRNYGGLDGLPEMKELFAPLFEVPAAQIVIGGNSSLQIMHDTVVRALTHGVPGSKEPWSKQKVRFLCPSPGYDRHFAICEHFGIEMINVELGKDGPNLDQVESLVAGDASIKGMWCVPKYSNPTGTTYSDSAVDRLASMKAAAPDFRLFWDNAYAIHDLYAEGDRLKNVIQACKAAGNEDRPLVFASTSKVSFAGAGIAAMASSPANVADAKKHLGFQTIGPDKLNQLRHVAFFGDYAGVLRHMQRHAEILRPKFEAVTQIFARDLGGKGIATWTEPRGGYFISLDTLDGCAKEVVSLANQAGVKLTAAGATFPYGKDPRDRNIRVAPSLPPLEQIKTAMEIVCTCVELASVRKLLG